MATTLNIESVIYHTICFLIIINYLVWDFRFLLIHDISCWFLISSQRCLEAGCCHLVRSLLGESLLLPPHIIVRSHPLCWQCVALYIVHCIKILSEIRKISASHKWLKEICSKVKVVSRISLQSRRSVMQWSRLWRHNIDVWSGVIGRIP